MGIYNAFIAHCTEAIMGKWCNSFFFNLSCQTKTFTLVSACCLPRERTRPNICCNIVCVAYVWPSSINNILKAAHYGMKFLQHYSRKKAIVSYLFSTTCPPVLVSYLRPWFLNQNDLQKDLDIEYATRNNNYVCIFRTKHLTIILTTLEENTRPKWWYCHCLAFTAVICEVWFQGSKFSCLCQAEIMKTDRMEYV